MEAHSDEPGHSANGPPAPAPGRTLATWSPPLPSDQPSTAAKLLIAASYLLLGAVGLGLSVSAGFGSPLFPAAGLALAAALHFGTRALPAVWIGSALLHLGLAGFRGTLSLSAVAAAALIASGACAQAWAGQALIRHRQGEAWRHLEHEREVLAFLLLGGPLACLVSATIGATVLLLLGPVSLPALPFTWWNWFVGDTLGTLILTPLCLSLMMHGPPLWRARRRRLVAPMVMTLLFIGAAFHATYLWEQHSQHSRLEADGERIQKRLDERLLAHREALQALRRFIEVSPDPSPAQFDAYTLATLQDNPDISALSLNVLVSDAERDAFEKAMARRLGRPDYRISEFAEAGQYRTAGRRDRYVVISDIRPRETNHRAIGFDIASEPLRRDAIGRALAMGNGIAATAPIRLVQENRVAVLALASVQTPQATPRGFAVAVVKVGQLVDMTVRAGLPVGLHLELTDPQAGNAALLDDDDVPAVRPVRASWTAPLYFGDREWRLTVSADDRYLAHNRPWIAWGVGIVGMLFATLLQTLILGMTGRHAIIQRQVDRQTEDLASTNRELALAKISIDHSADAAYWMRNDGHIVRVNQAACDMLGYTERELTALGVPDIDKHFDQATWDAHQSRVCTHGSELLESVHCRKDGSEIAVAITASRVEADGQAYVYATVRDITERKRTEAELEDHRHHLEELVAARTTELSLAKDAAEAASRAKTRFLANMSHELRTPMNAILGLTHMIRRSNTDPLQQERLDKISGAASHLLHQLNDMLELARIDTDQLPVEQVRFELAEIIAQVVRLVGASLEGKGLALRIDLDAPSRAQALLGDPQRLLQVLVHIVDNAIKFTPSGGITLRSRLVDEGRQTALLRIEVEDTGIGIDADAQARIFQPFEQVDDSSTRRFGGSGLGLAMCQRLVRLMGGDIGVHSTIDHGSTFWFTLRVGRLPERAAPAAPALSGAEAERLLRSEHRDKRVLLVEDDWVNQEVILELLRDETGLQADLAANGAEAVRMASGQAYDLILMDLQMPVMDGLAASCAIRALPGAAARIPIVAMSANTFDEDRQACVEAGMNDFIAKPTDPDILFLTILRWLQHGPADAR